MRIFATFIVLLGFIATSGCNKSPGDSISPLDILPSSATPHLSTVQPASTPQEDTAPMLPTPITTKLQNLIQIARDDLAIRLSILSTKINLMEAREVTWSDSSLGCPTEGMMYAQVLTPGYLIVLEYAGNNYEYHAGRGPDVLYCSNPLPPVPGIPDNT